jgi:hypothetical protein
MLEAGSSNLLTRMIRTPGRVETGAGLQLPSGRFDSGGVLGDDGPMWRKQADARSLNLRIVAGSIPAIGMVKRASKARLGLIIPACWERYPGPQ